MYIHHTVTKSECHLEKRDITSSYQEDFANIGINFGELLGDIYNHQVIFHKLLQFIKCLNI